MGLPALSKTDIDPGVISLVEMSLRAGAAILDVYRSADADIAEKADGSPVTAADQRAERIILEGLTAAFPDVPVVAEEAVEAGHLPNVSDLYFLVDPLDGTKEFVKRNGEFTVNIALVQNGVPQFGVVYAPAIGEIYWGGTLTAVYESEAPSNSGAYFARVNGMDIDDIAPIRVRAISSDKICAVTSRSHACAETNALIARLNVDEQVSVGSSLKLCWVAAGKADIYPRLAPTMQWDIAAGDAILRAAGGHVLVESSKDALTYRIPKNAAKADLKNPNFIAINDPALLSKRES